MNPRYPSNLGLTVKTGFDKLECCSAETVSRGRISKVADLFAGLRETLKLSPRRVLYVAFRPVGWDTWKLGTYRKDKLGRVRWYDGWPHHNGLTQLAARNVFPGQ